MAHIPFFYSSDTKTLNEEDTHHFKRVLRKKIGEKFLVGNGNGQIWWAIAKDFSSKKLVFEIQSLKEKKDRKKISIGVAIPKGYRASFLIEKICEIGVDKIYLLETKYGSVKITERMVKRFNSIARAACIQSEKAYLTVVENPIPLKKITGIFKNIFVLDITGEKENWKKFEKDIEILLVGPEGGWAEEEKIFFQEKNIPFLPLTDEPLRIETAAIVGLSFYYSFSLL